MATARINPVKVAKLVRGPIGESSASVYEVKLDNDSGDLVTHHVDDRFHLQRRRDAALRAVRRHGRAAA